MNDFLFLALTPVWRVALALSPTLIFLALLYALDARRLVRLPRVWGAMLAGGFAAGLSYLLNNRLLGWSGLSLLSFAVVMAPVVEELLKALYCGWLVQTRRVGFLVEGSILGFAVGTGFALVENLYYLNHLDRPDLLIWAVRGLGTAVMHGGASAVFTVLLLGLKRWESSRWPWGVALAAAILLHGGFNRMLIHPVMATVGVLVIMPLVLALVYRLGESGLQRWLGRGMDRDLALLALINSGRVDVSPLGTYLRDLKTHFKAGDVVDMLCLLRLQAELNLVVRGGMLLRENGLEGSLPADLPERLVEVEHLQLSLGRTGRLALRPVSRWRGSHPWQWHRLHQWLHEREL